MNDLFLTGLEKDIVKSSNIKYIIVKIHPPQHMWRLSFQHLSPLGWLTHAHAFESMTLMFQREVAERITAWPSDRAYSRLSILTRWLADSEILFDVPASAFIPAPKVTSSIVQIVPLPAPRFPCSQTALEEVTRIAFGQRRKMLRSSLKNIGGERLLNAAKIDPL